MSDTSNMGYEEGGFEQLPVSEKGRATVGQDLTRATFYIEQRLMPQPVGTKGTIYVNDEEQAKKETRALKTVARMKDRTLSITQYKLPDGRIQLGVVLQPLREFTPEQELNRDLGLQIDRVKKANEKVVFTKAQAELTEAARKPDSKGKIFNDQQAKQAIVDALAKAEEHQQILSAMQAFPPDGALYAQYRVKLRENSIKTPGDKVKLMQETLKPAAPPAPARQSKAS